MCWYTAGLRAAVEMKLRPSKRWLYIRRDDDDPLAAQKPAGAELGLAYTRRGVGGELMKMAGSWVTAFSRSASFSLKPSSSGGHDHRVPPARIPWADSHPVGAGTTPRRPRPQGLMISRRVLPPR